MFCQQACHCSVLLFSKVQTKVLPSSLHSRYLCPPLAILLLLALVFALVLLLALFLLAALLLALLCLALLACALALCSFWQLPARFSSGQPFLFLSG